MRITRIRVGLALALIILLGVFAFGALRPTRAQSGANCSEAYAIDATLPSGARWTMCWEDRHNEGIVLYEIKFTPPGEAERLILSQANLAQIHVPYDDNGARLHDLSDFGLGGIFLSELTADECPGGALLQSNNRNVLCMQIAPYGYAYKYYATQARGYALALFSVSQVGQYNYIVRWGFYDNGAIEPGVGATGKLQRYSDLPQYGWPVDTTQPMYGVSHTHNYYWRLDFDLNESQHDVVEEIAFAPSGDQATFAIQQTAIITESARQVSQTIFRAWRVKDNLLANADGHAISFEIEPDASHVFRGPVYEPWTQAEFYVTHYNPCEKWASHNPTTGGCGSDLTEFVNGEALDDPVVWYGHSFHHLPRDEDQDFINTHWSQFSIQPRDWTAKNPLRNISPRIYLPLIMK
jgi:primary-amine oxidase